MGGDIAGGVERLTPRATYLRSVDGRLHVVSNGAIRSYPISPATGRAMVDLGVAYEEDLDRVPAMLAQKAKAFAQEPEIAGQLIEAPTVVGPLDLGDWAVTVRVMIKTLPVGCGACAAETLARSVRTQADHSPLSPAGGDGA